MAIHSCTYKVVPHFGTLVLRCVLTMKLMLHERSRQEAYSDPWNLFGRPICEKFAPQVFGTVYAYSIVVVVVVVYICIANTLIIATVYVN